MMDGWLREMPRQRREGGKEIMGMNESERMQCAVSKEMHNPTTQLTTLARFTTTVTSLCENPKPTTHAKNREEGTISHPPPPTYLM
jgi:hypothetical protein